MMSPTPEDTPTETTETLRREVHARLHLLAAARPKSLDGFARRQRFWGTTLFPESAGLRPVGQEPGNCIVPRLNSKTGTPSHHRSRG